MATSSKKYLRNSLLLILFFSFTFSSCHFVRSIIYLNPDHKDHKKFPKRELLASDVQFDIPYAKTQLDPSEYFLQLKDSTIVSFKEALRASKTSAFMILKNNEIVFEEYFGAYDEDKPHTSFSVSKAMLASLLGIALDEAMIASYQDPIVKYLPELMENDSAFQFITVQHIFEMTSGINVRKKDASLLGDLGRTYYGNNWSRFMSTIEIEFPAGTHHEYKQTDAQLLTLILTRASGMSIADFFQDRIWSKIGSEQSAYWNYYKKDTVERGFCCYNAIVQDYAKFGLLYANMGNWQGEQLIPEEWVKFTTQRVEPEALKPGWLFDFHKHWFLSSTGEEYTAQGYNGQMIYVNPEKNIVILRFGKRRWKQLDLETWVVSLANQL